MRDDNKNLIMAIAMSVAVLIGWNYFFGSPLMEKQKQSQQQPAPQAAGSGHTGPTIPGAAPQQGQPSTPSASTVPGVAGSGVLQTREAALSRSPRIRIDTPALSGSLALKGARVDDVSLKRYHETVDPKSPEIVLLSPPGSPTPYYAEFGWVGPGAPNQDTVWTADSQVLTPERPVTLTYDNGQGLVFRRQISVDDKFVFTLQDTVENKGSAPVSLNAYGLVSRHGKPPTQGYYVLHEGMIGVVGDHGLQEYGYSALDKEPPIPGQPTRGKVWDGVTGGFVGITDKYWAAAILPNQQLPYQGSFTSREDNKQFTYQANVLGETKTIAPGATLELTQHLFAGAKEVTQIDAYEKALGIKKFDLLIDWGWFYFITKPMFKALDFFYRMFGNFGVSILIVTVFLKLFFLPLANKSYASMAKMKAVQPEMTAIRERYKDDKAKQQQEMMALYKREKINPVAGCWPILIQIPVFFALYKVLFVTIEMRHAPFFGWIRDLAAPDPTSIFNLFGLLPFSVPEFLHIGVWPIIMGITMFLQMKMNPEPPDPIQKAMFSWMPLIFTFMLASFPAGLVIYWAWNNLLSVAQQYVIMRRHGVKVELWDNLRGMFAKKKPPAEAKS
ncbi:membrane protein insertase YidC [Enterovirga rhinocerotis]|uniref:Membrane protein insertase YidC n=1 Tax=Enterovirga rhinocerotis TaxID=1339210 RepID=A0A4R7C636_9HYPH|nr:membrane protein insertase YidC [Enterovirga rhinocerotis]TDR93382.1 YidC/Oxa1 family membrane protein insertase [Enterovirga rhinocerotis]